MAWVSSDLTYRPQNVPGCCSYFPCTDSCMAGLQLGSRHGVARCRATGVYKNIAQRPLAAEFLGLVLNIN